MPFEIVENPPPPPKKEASITQGLRWQKAGQTLRADVASLGSLRNIAARVTAEYATGAREYHCWEVDGKFFVERRA